MQEILTCYIYTGYSKRKKIPYLTVVRDLKERHRNAVITSETGTISWSWD